MGVIRYVSHPEVLIDPAVPVPWWSLSDIGRARAIEGARRPWAGDIDRIVSSPETKAVETAEILATSSGTVVEVRDGIGEIDRSATGYVSHERHEQLADELFLRPDESAAGWERAVDATARMVGHLDDLLLPGADGHVVVVGHGGVGTLLMCHVAGLQVARARDQPRGGCHWAWDTLGQQLVHDWQPIDASR